jgi:hypothetical protein
MSAAAGGALGEAHRVGGDIEAMAGLQCRSNSNAIDGDAGGRRRSMRKREGKSYAEFGESDIYFEEDNSGPNSPVKGLNSRNSNAHKLNAESAPVSNGDVEMESEDDSDDDGPLEPLPLPKELPLEVLEERKALIRQLQTQLRNEEMSLVLLKKIRQSQVLAEQAKEAKVSIQPASVSSRTSQNTTTHRGTPPLGASGSQKVRGSGSTSNSSGAIKNSGVKSVLTPDLSHLKPVSVDPKNLPTGLPANLVSLMSKGTLGATKLTEVSKTPKMDTETPAQKQAAAKLALRKQLEKTLLQIPPPKPPPPEMHFIPNPTNTEFICLLGLEECVSKILNEDKENSIQPVPFSCSQCGTDFTPTWKWDKGAKGKEVKVICEQCVTTNVKKALKAEHTNRLKAAFVKALQQEQELEAHMAAQASSQSSSSARIASPDSRGRNSVDVTVRPASSSTSNRSIPSAHQTSRTTITTSASSAATLERAYRGSPSSASISRSAMGGGGGSSSQSRSSSNNLSSLSRSTYNNGGLTNSSRSGSSSSSSKADSMASANAMAAQLQALMAMGGGYGASGGNDAAAAQTMALLQAAAMQQQLAMTGYGGGSGGSSSGSGGRSGGGSSNHSSSSRSAGSASSSNDLNSQMAAMAALMNPMMYNTYQAAAMAQMLGGSSGSSSSGKSGSGSGSSGSSSSNAASNQMMDIQRQITEQMQRQYMLEMISPGNNLGGSSWGSKK